LAAPANTFLLKGAGYALIKIPGTGTGASYSDGLVEARLAKLGNMTLELDFPSDPVFGGASLYQFDSVDKDRKVGLSFENAEFDLNILTPLAGTTVAKGTSVEVPIFDEAGAVPAVTTYTITLAKSATAVVGSETVRFADTGVYLTRVASAPATGQYSIASGVLTFAAADASKNVLTDYRYTVADGNMAPVLSTDLVPTVEIWHAHTFNDYAGNAMKFVTHVFRAKANGKLNVDQKRQSASTHKLDFDILDPGRSDNKILTFGTARV